MSAPGRWLAGWRWRALLGAALIPGAAPAVAAQELVVGEAAAPCLNVRAAPQSGGRVLACVPPGTALEQVDRRQGWIAVRLSDGGVGWCVGQYLEPAPPSAEPSAPAPAVVAPSQPAPAAAAAPSAERPAVTPPAAAPAGPPLTPPSELTRITFDIPFPEERGGGSAVGSAATVETVGDSLVVASGGVEFRYREMSVQAQRIEVDRLTRDVVAEGEVILDEGPRRTTGSRLEYNLDSRTGRMIDARLFADPDVYFSGSEVVMLGDDLYTLKDGVVTSCIGDNPGWSFRTTSTRVRLEGFARVRNATMRVKSMPVFYLPYLLLPAKSERAAGLLFPNFGSSQQRGSYLGLAYFQPFGPSYDATLFLDLYSDDFTGLGTEVRYQPSESTTGWFEGYAIEDPLADETRWKVAWDHASDDLPLGLRGVIRVRDYSDFNFFQDFERNFNNISIRRIDSAAFVSGNWGAHSLNVLLAQSETFIRGNDKVVTRQLPEIDYRLRSYQFGELPLFLDLASSVNLIGIERTGLFDTSYMRVDLAPEFTSPLSTLPWLSVAVGGGGRITWYEDSLTEDTGEFGGGSLTRVFPTAGGLIVGPSLSRVFDKQIGPFAKFKHIFEPRWGYVFIGDFEDRNRLLVFDEIDTLRSSNIFGYALVNRVLAKPANEEELGGPREIFSFEINQSFSLNEDEPLQGSRDGTRRTTDGPLSAQLRFNPGATLSLEARAQYNTLFGNLDSTSLTTGFSIARQQFYLSWFTRYNAELGTESSDQLRFSASFELLPGRLSLGSTVNYDVLNDFVQAHRHGLIFNGQCWGFQLEYSQISSGLRDDWDFRFALSLKNVGTFLDLTGGSRGSQY